MIIVAYFSLSIWPTRIHSTEIETLGCALLHVWDRICQSLMMAELWSLEVTDFWIIVDEQSKNDNFEAIYTSGNDNLFLALNP